MIEQFEAVTYKGLSNFSLGPMRRVNLVTGPNGVGKSSLIEALWLFHGRYNPSLLWNLHLQRRQSHQGSSPLDLLTGGRPISLRGREDGHSYQVTFRYEDIVQPLQKGPNGSSHLGAYDAGEEIEAGSANVSPDLIEGLNLLPIVGSLRADYGPNDPHAREFQSPVIAGPTGPALQRSSIPTGRPTGIIMNRDAPFPVGSDRVESYSKVVARGEKRRLLEMLRLIRPHIRDIEILSHQGTPSLWAEVGDLGLLPLEAAGGGVVRLLGLLVSFFNAEGGVLVIDEIENGIHHSTLENLWEQVRRISSILEVQTVVTTHGLECLKAAINVADREHAHAEFVVHQLYQTKDGERRTETYTDDKLTAALDLGFDIR